MAAGQDLVGKAANEAAQLAKDGAAVARLIASGGTDISSWIRLLKRWLLRLCFFILSIAIVFIQVLAGAETASAECGNGGGAIALGASFQAQGAGDPDPTLITTIYNAVNQKYQGSPDLGKVMQATFEAALAESGIRNLAGGDRDSVGIFQQRAGWGSTEERMNPTWSVNAFLSALDKQRINHPDYAPHALAQATQISMCQGDGVNNSQCGGVYGGNYLKQQTRAQDIITKAGGTPSAPAGAATGGVTPGSNNGVAGATSVTPVSSSACPGGFNAGANLSGQKNVVKNSKGIDWTIDVVPDGPRGAAVSAALSQLGVNYVWGGTAWGSGLDCSGLTSGALTRAVSQQTPSGIQVPRTAKMQYTVVKNPVSLGSPDQARQLLPGDLIFYSDGGPDIIHHVAMYLGLGSGGGKTEVPLLVEAPYTGEVVSIRPVYPNGNSWGGDPGFPAIASAPADPNAQPGAPTITPGNLPVKAA